MSKPKADNLTWHNALVTREDRERLLPQKGCVVWLTGLSGSGKSTIARALEKRLLEGGHLAYVLDGDNVRHGLNANLGFSPEDRAENIRRIGEVAALFADAGVIVIAAFISPYRAGRDHARRVAPDGRFVEVFLDVDVNVCEQRDPKQLYKKARAGEIAGFTGIDAPYEKPPEPELAVDTSRRDLEGCVEAILRTLQERGLIG
ncbi:MAG: adenylyl-sulfate kinase [Phycisphaerae bacterium]